MEKLVFLGGTSGNNNWRDHFISILVSKGIKEEILFNPVVKDWNEEAQARSVSPGSPQRQCVRAGTPAHSK